MTAPPLPPSADEDALPPGFPVDWERNWSVFCHLGGMAAYLVPLANVAAPLVLWMMRRDQSEYVDHHGREALNFQISMTLYAAVAAALWWLLLPVLVLIAIAVLDFVLMIVAAVRASQGEHYRYPLTLRLIS